MPKWSELFTPTDKQVAALDAIRRSKFVLYGGARGGSKSHLLRWWLLQFLIEMYKMGYENARVMLACESYPVLQDRQVAKISTEFPSWLGEVKTTKTEGLGFYIRPEYGGGAIMLRNLDNPEKYMGAEFAAIGVDQIEKIQKDTFDILIGSLRWPNFKQTKFVATANPGGYAWVKQLWIDKNFPPEMSNFASSFEFVQALPKDNPYLDSSYWEGLRMLPEQIQKAWIDGDWNVFSGQAFPQFCDDHICEPFEIPVHWMKFRGIDWGYTAPFACVWIAKDPASGRVYLYREMLKKNLMDRWQAKAIRDATPPQEGITASYADPSMWTPNTKGREEVTSSVDEYLKEGVYLQKADNNRLSGKRKIDRILEKLPDGRPGFMVFNTCKEFIRTFPYLMLNDPDHGDVEDVASKGTDDHCFVAGTLVDTERGQVPIENITLDDKVLTNIGYMPITMCGRTQEEAQTYLANFDNGTSIQGTGNHPVFVLGKGFIRLDTLSYCDTIVVNTIKNGSQWQKLTASYLKALHTVDTQIQSCYPVTDTTSQMDTTGNAESDDFIKKCGEAFMEIYQRATTFTTGMGIPSTTIFPTSNVLKDTNTAVSINTITAHLLNTWHEYKKWQKSGIDQTRDESGTVSMESRVGKIEIPSRLFVSNAGLNLLQWLTEKETSAPVIVKRNAAVLRELITLSEYVVFAEKTLQQINTLILEHAEENAVRCLGVKKADKQPVYNLSVEQSNMYFANGVMVHNCYDALRYALSSIRTDIDPIRNRRSLVRNPMMDLRGI